MSVSNVEMESIVKLFPLLSSNPTIFDVGSNKGEWSDIFLKTDITHKSNFHFFEPNEIMINYTKIKYDYNTNIIYNKNAVWSEDYEKLDFFYFTNYNNGLSCVIKNEKWATLPMQKGFAESITIDTYCKINKIDFIDFLKIDVEGVEYEVLKGCKSMLTNGSIKFLQVECSEHYHLINKKFNDVIEYFEQFGYMVFSYKDGQYIRQIKEDFVHDDQLQNFIVTRCQIQNTQNWNQIFIDNTNSIGKFDFVLEVGAFEGITSKYICENMIKEGGRMIAIDPLEDNYIVENVNEYASQLNSQLAYFKDQYSRFLINTQNLPIELIRSTLSQSREKIKDLLFDFIYIDGDHRADAVYLDARICFNQLRSGGYILFDDYEWGNGETKRGVDNFIKENKSQIEIVFIKEQALIRKK
jgi:FkbM family methyltransferase